MHNDARILELLEEIMESKRTPEEVCAQDPELLSLVHERLRRLKRVEAQVEALFPTSNPLDQRDRTSGGVPQTPEIPGYEIDSILGYGGMGVVYKVRHLKLDRSVAI